MVMILTIILMEIITILVPASSTALAPNAIKNCTLATGSLVFFVFPFLGGFSSVLFVSFDSVSLEYFSSISLGALFAVR